MRRPSLRTLQQRAAESTAHCGHRMRWVDDARGVGIRYGTCTRCGMDVTLTTHPAPNDIDISGEAVALDCPPLTMWRYYCGDPTCVQYHVVVHHTPALTKSRSGAPVVPACAVCFSRCYYAQPGVPVPAPEGAPRS